MGHIVFTASGQKGRERDDSARRREREDVVVESQKVGLPLLEPNFHPLW